MTEGELNLLVLQVESKLEAMCSHNGPGMTREAVVGSRWLASVLVDNERLRQHVTELQTHNTALTERARKAEDDRCAIEGEIAPSRELAEALAEQCKEMHADRVSAMRERDQARAATAELTAACEARNIAVEDMAKRLEATGADLAKATKDLAEARTALAREREQHSRLREQWEIMSRELASTRMDRQRLMFERDKWQAETDARAVAFTSSLDGYQHAAMRTTIHPHGFAGKDALAWNALGITGEAGEVADLIKKHVGHGHELDRAELTRELGDVLWYVAALAHDIGVNMSTVARENVEKLKARYPDGFDQERSKNRVAE